VPGRFPNSILQRCARGRSGLEATEDETISRPTANGAPATVASGWLLPTLPRPTPGHPDHAVDLRRGSGRLDSTARGWPARLCLPAATRGAAYQARNES